MYTTILTVLSSAVALTNAANPLLTRQGPVQGVATFNPYAQQFAQSGTVCGIAKPANGNYFGAAASDISSSAINPGACTGTFEGPQDQAPYDRSKCKTDGSGSPIDGYQGPSCPRDHCPDVNPTCYKVRNLGDISSPPGQPQGEEITVQIIDVCPGGHAQNYCKPASIDARTRCQSYGTNELDIDEPAYVKLTGREFGDGVPNLNIQITPVAC